MARKTTPARGRTGARKAMPKPAAKHARKAPAAKPAPADADALLAALVKRTGLDEAAVRLRALRTLAAALDVDFAPAPAAEAPRAAAAAPAPAAAPVAPAAAAPAAAQAPAAPDAPQEGPALAPEVRLYVHGIGRPPMEMLRDVYTIGSGQKSDLWVNMPKIETHHCQVVREGSAYYLEDLGSAAGTYFADGRKLEERHRLEDGEVFYLAKYHKVRFYLLPNT